jgi:hypothetical protein
MEMGEVPTPKRNVQGAGGPYSVKIIRAGSPQESKVGYNSIYNWADPSWLTNKRGELKQS